MGNWVCLVWKAPGCFRAFARLIRRYEKVYKIAARAFWGIFSRSISIPGLYSPLLIVLVLRSFCRIQVRKSYITKNPESGEGPKLLWVSGHPDSHLRKMWILCDNRCANR